jgi:RHS repeat-associated protein
MQPVKVLSIWIICGILLVSGLFFAKEGHSSSTAGTFDSATLASVQSWKAGIAYTCPYILGYYPDGGAAQAATSASPYGTYGGWYFWDGVWDRFAWYAWRISCCGYCYDMLWLYPHGQGTYFTTSYVPDTSEAPDKNQGKPQNGACVANPINVATGNKYEPVTDLAISTPGLPFEFRRYYNSTVIANGPLGYGWTHSFSLSLQVAQTYPTLRIKIIDADGTALYFRQVFLTNGTSSFFGESGVKDKLIKLASGEYKLRRKKDNLTYLFGTNGKLTQVSDPNGNTLTLTYTSGLVTQVTNNFGKTLTIQYNSSRISSITDPKNQSITYTYTSSNLTSVAYPDSQSISYAYDANHRLTDKYDTSSNLIGHWHYNTNGKVDTYYRFLKDSVPQERIDFSYTTSEPRTITLTRSTGTTTYTGAINDGIRVITGIEGCGATCGGDTNKTFTYDQWVNLTDSTSISGAQSYTTHYSYDEPANFWDRVGEVVEKTEAVGFPEERATGYTYTHRTDDPFLLTQSTETKVSVLASGQNKVTTTNYDSYGRITSRTEAGYVLVNSVPTQRTYTTGFQYNSLGQLTQINGPRTDVSDVTTLAYYANDSGQGNNRAQLMTVTDALGHITQYTNYDANGNVGTITDPNGVVTQLTYDQRNRIKTVTNQSTSAVTEYFYDARGNISYIIPPEGNRVDFAYNLADRVTQITDNLGNKIQYEYDVEGNRTGEDIFDPQQNLKKSLDFTFDAYNRLKRIVNPDTTYTEYTYDAKGNRTAVKDPRNNTTNLAYDALDRLVQTTQPLTTITDQGYDTQDNLISVTDPMTSTTQYWFDDFGRKNHAASPDTGATQYLYDEAGNLTQQVDAKGTVINYAYDALNRITSVQFPADSTQNITYTYDSTSVTYGIGKLTGRTDTSGTYIFYYDAQGKMAREDKTVSGILYTTQYAYNKNNALTSITYPSGRTVTYSFDGAGRISQVSAIISGNLATLASSITYLPFGGLAGLIYGNSLSLTQEYNNQYRIASITVGSVLDLTYGYDANGNITSILDAINPPGGEPAEPTGVYSYEQGSNVLAAITGSSSATFVSDLNGNTTSENNRVYGYDLLNRLITVTDNGNQIAVYTYNAMNHRMQKVTGVGTTIFHYDPKGHLIAETNQSGQTLVEYIYLGDQPLAMIRSTEQAYYYHNDHLGTPRVLTDGSGNVVWKALYAPFGAATITTANFENKIRFPGQYCDTETGLHYNWNRYYDPKTGRYVTPDPIGLEGGINLYSYVEGNPINKTDPLGLDAYMCIKPLDVFGGSGWKSGFDIAINPLYHQYICVNNLCGGQTHLWPFLWSPGTPSDDKFNKDRCEKMDDRPCMDECLTKKIQDFKRPFYGIFFLGTNCQKWASDAHASCVLQCRGKGE